MVDKSAKRLALQAIRLAEVNELYYVELRSPTDGFRINLQFTGEIGAGKGYYLIEIHNGGDSIFKGKASMLTDEVDENLCPRCEQNPIMEGDYLCHECRDGS